MKQERRARNSEVAAEWLIALAPLAEVPAKLSAHQREVLARLDAVVAERKELDDELLDAASELAGVAARAAADRVISTSFARELVFLGYSVEVTFGASDTPEHLSVSRAEWGAASHAEVNIYAGDLNVTFHADPSAGQADLHVSDWVKDVAEVKRRTAEGGVRSGEL